MSVTVTLSGQTVEWVQKAVENYDPLTVAVEENSPAMLACLAIHNLIRSASSA